MVKITHICDMCGRDLEDRPYWEISAKSHAIETTIAPDELDLCPYCFGILKSNMKQYRRSKEDFDKLFSE